MYDYSVTTSTALLGTFDDDTHLHITAKAHIDVSAPCEYILRVTDVTLEGSSHTEDFSAAVSRTPLRFSFQGGVVDSLCSEISEPAWVLNFKRGVLSAFQSSTTAHGAQTVLEKDISGVCQTHYDSELGDNILTIKKEKNLASCTGRPSLTSYIPSSGYAADSPVQSLPIFKSTSKCQQRIEDGVLVMAECEESHKFRPFSSDEGGAVTLAKTTMVLVSQNTPARPLADYQFYSKTLVFDQISTHNAETQIETVEKILSDLEVASHNEVLPEVPVLFSTLVASLKTLDYPSLNTIYANTKEIHSRKFLVDAMPLVGTAAAVGVVRDMFINGDMTNTDADVWFTSLAFFENPTSDMFTALAPLLQHYPSQDAMLGTSALINTYCKLHSDCGSDSGVQQILRNFESYLGSGCRTISGENKRKVLVALKALGNAGRWVNASPVLHQCYTEDNDMEIRVAAIEAWRHTPCEYDRSNLLHAFQDETQDTEIRIAAYLAVMTCPTPTVVNIIKDRLISEGVNQVGSFIWTHMVNLQESAAQGKQWVRELIGEDLLQKKFSTEALKFSRNYESSFFMNELNAGAVAESNVIFSSKSYLPRSAMLNLTLDLFGESINLFEIGGRIEGFEAYVERFFGPSGYFPEETIESILRNMRQKKTDSDATTLEGFFDKITDEPQGSYYLRVFGNELYYNHFHGLENLMKSSGFSNPLDLLMELARKGDVDYTKSYQLIDTHYTIPTVTGLPVVLTAKGTATLALKMIGSFKAQSFKDINIEGRFHPSAAVQMDGQMVVDAHVTSTGLKISSTLHTSTFLDGKVQIDGGKLVDITFNTPKDKVEVIDVSTKFFYLEDDQEIRKEVENEEKSEGCMRIISGLDMCAEVGYTSTSDISPHFPLSGPASIHAYLKKTDTQTGYNLRFTNENNYISFLFDTPESQVNRKVSLTIAKSEQNLKVDLETPLISLQGNGEYTWRKNNKHIKLDLMMDHAARYTVETGLQISGKNIRKIEPSLVITSPRGEILNVKGTLKASVTNTNYTADLSVSGLTVPPVVLHASYEGEAKSANVEVMLETPMYDFNTKGQLAYDDNFVSSKANIEYSVLKGEKHTISYSALIKKEISEEVNTYTTKFELTPSQYRDMALDIDFSVILSTGRMEQIGKITRGTTTWTIKEMYSYNNDDGNYTLTALSEISCPLLSINYHASHELRFGRNYLNIKSQMQFLPKENYVFAVDFNKNNDFDIEARVSSQAGDTKASIEFLLNEVANGHYKAKLTKSVITSEGEKTSILEGSLQNNSQPGKFNVLMDGSFKSPENTVTTNLGIYGDKTKASVDFSADVNGRPGEFALKFEVTRSSILVDANVYKHIFINAYVTTIEEIQKLLVSVDLDKNGDRNQSFEISGQLSPSHVEAAFRFQERKASASFNLVDDGIEMEAKWSPEQKVSAHVHYSLGDAISLATAVETTFQGWEKQDVTFTITLKDYEITSRASATWRNTELMVLTVNGKLQPGMYTNALNAEILFSSTLESFDKISFILDHNMGYATIKTNFVGLWNKSEMKGSFQLTPSDSGIDATAIFTSPLTEDVYVTLHHELLNSALWSKLEAKYGAETCTITLKGQVNLGDIQDITLVMRMTSTLSTLPQINANVKYTLSEGNVNLVVEGKTGEKKMMLNMNGDKTVTGSLTAISGDLRFITPFTSPLTATLSHSHDGQRFTSQFEISRFWSNLGSLKMHAEGHMISVSDMKLDAVLSSPDTKASLSFAHKVTDNEMISAIDAIANGERITVTVNGILDAAKKLLNLEGEISSTFNGLDDINVKIDSKMEANIRTSNISLTKGSQSLDVLHTIRFVDLLNWDSSFTINGMYKLSDRQSYSGTTYAHELRYMWGEEGVHFMASVDPRISEDSRKIDAQVILGTPWKNYENIKVDLHYQDDGAEYKPAIRIEYKPGSIIDIATVAKFGTSSFYSESSLTTPFWQPLGYKLNLDFQPQLAATLELTRGANKTIININGTWKPGMFDGHVDIESTYFSVPLSVTSSYDIISPEKKVSLLVNADRKYEFTGSLAGHVKNAKWSLAAELPFEAVSSFEFSGEYQYMTMPFITNMVLKLNSNIYALSSKVNTNGFTINVEANDLKGSLESMWFYQHNRANMEIKFQSPLPTVSNMAAYIMYDFETQKKVHIKMTHGTQEINFIGKLEGETLVFEGTTPYRGWETLNASFFVSKSAITANISRNDTKIKVSGTMEIKHGKGKIEMTITTPFANFENISVKITYNLQGGTKMAEFRALFGTKELYLNGIIKLSNPLTPEMKLDIITPFEVIKTVGGEARWNMKDSVKTIEVTANHNDAQYKWQLEAAAEGVTKGYALATISTPVVGWRSVSVRGSFDFTTRPYKVAFTNDKEGVVSTIEGHLFITQNEITGEITTPISGWEKLALNGVYTINNNGLTGNIEFDKGYEKYEASGNIMFNSHTPKLKINIKTPIADVNNIELSLDTTVIGADKTFRLAFINNDIIYSAEFTGQFIYKTGFFKILIRSPIPEYTDLEIYAKYDFTGDVKTIELNLKKETHKHHFFIALKMNRDNFVIDVVTPFTGFEVLKVNGHYTNERGQHSFVGSFVKNDNTYNFRASAVVDVNKINLALTTPIAVINNVVFNASWDAFNDGIKGSVHFERNEEVFEFSTQASFTPMKSALYVGINTPVEGCNKLTMDISYDIISDNKFAEISVQKDNFSKIFRIDASYNLESGSLKIKTPFEGFEVLGAEYALFVDHNNRKMEASVKINHNSQEWIFSAYGQYGPDSFIIKFQMPFEDFNTIAAEGNIDIVTKTGKGIMKFGLHTFSINISYAVDNMFFELVTPFTALKTVSVSTAYTWTSSQKKAKVAVVYNENNYVLNGGLSVSPASMSITLQATTPINNYRNMSLQIKFDVGNRDKLMSAHITACQNTYYFAVSGYVEEKIAHFKCDLLSPFSGWTNVKFDGKVDFTREDKTLEISLERDGNVKAIAISGKLIGGTMDFKLKTPFTGLNNLNVSGSLNRAKRSLEFNMMNDAGEASLLTSFNSINLHLKTPFARAEEITWEIKKVDENSYKAEWRRNNNYVTASVVKTGGRGAFSLEVKSELQGWEFLALTGKLDQDAIEGYVSGTINEDKVTISIQGQHDVDSDFTINVTTPYENYQSVQGKISYNFRKKYIKIEASSSSSDFHFIFKYTRRNAIESHLLVPNPVQNTELKVNLSPLSGKLSFTSRFPALRNYDSEYKILIGDVVTVTHKVNVNNVDVFTVDFEGDKANQKAHFELHIRLPHRHSVIHVHREGFTTFNFVLKQEIDSQNGIEEKEFKIELSGSGNLPQEGTINAVITNSFREVPRTINAKIDVNRASQPKTLRIEINPVPHGLYIFDISYNINLQDCSHGDYDIKITTPDRSNAPWKHISGSWDTQNPQDAVITLNIGNVAYKAQGKLGLQESTMILTSDFTEKIFLQWKFKRQHNFRDYFLKLGRESRYGMLKLKGTITDIAHIDIEGGIKAGPFQSEEFLFTSKWNKGDDGVVTGEGSFDYGEYHGSHTIEEFLRDAEQRSATFKWTATSNIPQYEQISVSGNYDVSGKLVFHAEIKVHDRESKIDINISNLNPKRSRNTVEWDVPIFGELGKVQLTLTHNFRDVTSKSLSAVAKIGRRQAYVKANWNRSEEFDTFDGTIEIKSKFLGDINIFIKYDVTNIRDANAEVKYSRKTPGQEDKFVNINWRRQATDNSLKGEIVVESSLESLSHARVYVTADTVDVFHLKGGLEWNDKAVTVQFDISKNSVVGKLTTPFKKFESIEGELVFDLDSKNKVVTLKYARGSRTVDLNFTFSKKSKKKGDFELILTTPFEVVRNLNIKGSWTKAQATVNYQRNDIHYSFEGVADIQGGKSDFELSFSGPGRDPIKIAASYNVEDFLAGGGTEPKKLAGFELEFDGYRINFSLQGFRNSERLYIEIDGESLLENLWTFHLKLNSEFNLESRDGVFELKFNDFELKVHNHFERHENNGYYFKSLIESTLTPLPALVFGVGYKNDERILTIGYGADREITFSVKGKDNFRSGFSGFADIPNYGYEGVKYDVDYGFKSDDELFINVELELGEDDQEVEAEFTYNSEGVKARLTSPYTGEHSLRVRRSISSDSFFTEIGLDDYNLKLRGGFTGEETKRGAILEGDIFGNRFLIDFLFQCEGQQYCEGKLIIHTPFRGMEKMGGLFTLSNVSKNIMAHAEVILPSHRTPKITAELNLNLNNKIDGYVTVDVAGKPFTLKSNLVGSSLSEGYKGTVEMYTPLSGLSSVVINGKIKVEAMSVLEADLRIIEPYNTHELRIEYQLSPETLTAGFDLHSRSYDGIKWNFILNGLSSTHKNIEMTLGNDKISVGYTMDESSFKVTIDSLIRNIPRQFSLEAKYSSLETMEATLIIVNEDQTHRIHGEFRVVNSHVQGGLELISPLIKGTRKLTFDIAVPDASFKQINFDVTLVTSDTYSLYFEIDARTGVQVTVKIDTPCSSKVTASFEFLAASAGLVIETPTGIHKAKITWRVTSKMPSDWLATVELMSPLLEDNYSFSCMLSDNKANKIIKAELAVGSVRHSLEASTSMRNNGASFFLYIETPFKNINKATLQASLDFENIIQLQVAANFSENINTFNFEFDRDNQTLMTMVQSPYIPTGFVRAEAAVTGDMKKYMQLKTALKNSVKTISGVLDVEIPSSQDIKMNLKVATPFKGYKKMNFVGQYLKDEVTTIIISLDKPVSFTVNTQFANTDTAIKGNLKLKTSVEHFEFIEAELDVPLNKFAPKAFLTLPNNKYGAEVDFQHSILSKVSANLYLDEATYGGNLALRTKAPYELAYSYNLACITTNKFHLRTDSSFISVFV